MLVWRGGGGSDGCRGRASTEFIHGVAAWYLVGRVEAGLRRIHRAVGIKIVGARLVEMLGGGLVVVPSAQDGTSRASAGVSGT